MRVLLLSGGGFRGATQIFCIEQLLKENKYDLILGVSVGALNGVLAAQGDIDLMKEFWNSIDSNYPMFGIKDYLSFACHRGKGYYSLDPIAKKLEKYVSINKIQIPFGCGMVARETGEYFTVKYDQVKTDEQLYKSILASSAIAFLMEPVHLKIDGKTYIMSDGGHRHILPLAPENATDIDAVFCSSIAPSTNHKNEVDRIFEAFSWLLNIEMEGHTLTDFERLKLLVQSGKKIRVFAPKESPGSLLTADRATIQYRIKLGEEAYRNPIILT